MPMEWMTDKWYNAHCTVTKNWYTLKWTFRNPGEQLILGPKAKRSWGLKIGNNGEQNH